MADAATVKPTVKGSHPSLIAAMRAGSPFAKSFREGVIAGIVLFLLFVCWMFLRSGDTARSLQTLIPHKTVLIETIEEDPAPEEISAAAENQKSANKNALSAAPLEGLTEPHDDLLLPKVRMDDEMTPFNAYKRPFTPIEGRNRVSFVIVDYGLSERLSQSMLENLPPEVSLVLNPYAAQPAKWAMAARNDGHEFWMSLPMQTATFGSDDTGPLTILGSAKLEENQARLFHILGMATGYAGVVTQQDHVLKSDVAGTPELLRQIFGRGLALVESNPDIPAYGLSMAMEFAYPYTQNNFWIDADLRPSSIDRALQEVERQAMRKGKAVAFLHPYPVAVKKVQEWIAQADSKGLQAAPLSAMVP